MTVRILSAAAAAICAVAAAASASAGLIASQTLLPGQSAEVYLSAGPPPAWVNGNYWFVSGPPEPACGTSCHFSSNTQFQIMITGPGAQSAISQIFANNSVHDDEVMGGYPFVREFNYNVWEYFVMNQLVDDGIDSDQAIDVNFSLDKFGGRGAIVQDPALLDWQENVLGGEAWTTLQINYAYGFDFGVVSPVGGAVTFSLSAVPEPAAWLLMLVALFGLGVALRSRGGGRPSIAPG